MLKEEQIENFRKNYEKNPTNKIRQRMLYKVQLIDLIQDESTKLNQEFNLNIETHSVTNQKSSGRCWSFAGLNILREKVIKKCNLNNFELSGSYIAFYDKLERFNILLERLIKYKNEGKGLYDEYVSSLLERGMLDGGQFQYFSNLIDKYGVVPENSFPETYASSNTNEINIILSRLLRKFYLDLEKEMNNGEYLKENYMELAFNILTSVYGMPPKKFDFEYTDKTGKYHIVKNLSPKKFYDKYIGIDLVHNYVVISSYQDEKFKYNNIYEKEESSTISGRSDDTFLNLSPKEFQNLIIKQLKSGEPVYFSGIIQEKVLNGVWIDIIKRYGEIFGIDLELDCNSIIKTNGITSSHAMIITGANIVNNKIKKLKIENSWGKKYGDQGYCIATPDWFENYIYRIVINKKNLTKKQLKTLQKEKIKIKKWDIKF